MRIHRREYGNVYLHHLQSNKTSRAVVSKKLVVVPVVILLSCPILGRLVEGSMDHRLDSLLEHSVRPP